MAWDCTHIAASPTQLRVGVLLIIANSIAIVAIGALMYRLVTTVSPAIRLAYLGGRLFEGVFLAVGAVFVTLVIPATEAGDADLARVLIAGFKNLGRCSPIQYLSWSFVELALGASEYVIEVAKIVDLD